MGNLCSGKIRENELDLGRTAKDKEMLERAEQPKKVDDLEADFSKALKDIIFKLPSVKVKLPPANFD